MSRLTLTRRSDAPLWMPTSAPCSWQTKACHIEAVCKACHIEAVAYVAEWGIYYTKDLVVVSFPYPYQSYHSPKDTQLSFAQRHSTLPDATCRTRYLAAKKTAEKMSFQELFLRVGVTVGRHRTFSFVKPYPRELHSSGVTSTVLSNKSCRPATERPSWSLMRESV